MLELGGDRAGAATQSAGLARREVSQQLQRHRAKPQQPRIAGVLDRGTGVAERAATITELPVTVGQPVIAPESRERCRAAGIDGAVEADGM